MKIKLNNEQKLWFTSDTHYNHKNICRGITGWRTEDNKIPISQTRDFNDLGHMNNTIVNNINSVVGQDDILIHLGDWSFGGFESIGEFRNRIICRNIHLVLGNHDHHIENNRDNCRDLFLSVNHYIELEVIIPSIKLSTSRSYGFILMHYPIASWKDMNKGIYHLHGHVHLPPQHKISSGRAMDAGIDGNNIMPYGLSEVVKLLTNQPVSNLRLPSDHHEERLKGEQ
jgi:calcineurin-like phosphoesterase family protein